MTPENEATYLILTLQIKLFLALTVLVEKMLNMHYLIIFEPRNWFENLCFMHC